jgi:hypothetical protein
MVNLRQKLSLHLPIVLATNISASYVRNVSFSLVVRIDSPFEYDVEKSSGEFINGMSS